MKSSPEAIRLEISNINAKLQQIKEDRRIFARQDAALEQKVAMVAELDIHIDLESLDEASQALNKSLDKYEQLLKMHKSILESLL